MLRRYFGISALLTVLAVVVALVALGPAAAVTTMILIAIEIAFSFDNAIINAKVLERLSKFWQQLFLTIGMIFAIVGMRFVFPILIVMVTAHLPWHEVIDDALNHPEVYGKHLEAAHTAIAAFGGSFLLTLTLYFFFDDARSVLWLSRLERPMQKVGGTIWLPALLSTVAVLGVGLFSGNEAHEVIKAGVFGVLSYTGIKLLIDGLGKFTPKEQKLYSGWPAFLAFMYLQLLDASFSFDGVLGAFAITDKVLLIALGLGVGALWVRSLTVYMVRNGTLSSYKFLEHGAHYAILVLSLALLASIFIEVPDAITGIIGLGVIGASFWTSHQALQAKNRGKNS